MYTIGTVCMKIAGRDAGQLCVIVEEGKDGKVLVDGAVRRRLVNVRHLEPTGKTVDVKKGAVHAAVAKALGLTAKVSKPKKAGEKPRQQRATKAASEKPKKAPKAKAAPKAEKKPKKAAAKPAKEEAPASEE